MPSYDEVNPGSNSLWYRLVHLNPTLWRGLVVATVGLLLSIGVRISPDIPDNVILFIVALAAVLQGIWTRPAVTANAKVVTFLPDPVNEPAAISPGEAITTATDRAVIDAARTSGS